MDIMPDPNGAATHHLTTRRGFVLGAGFSIVSLYGLWAAYGAAPTDLDFAAGDNAESGGHGGHGGAMTREEFERLAAAFIAANGQPDGSVYPRSGAAGHGGHDMTEAGAAMIGDQMDHDMAMPMLGSHDATPEPVPVYLTAYRWGYEPAELRLEVGVPYRFRMMALAGSHGASIAFGPGSRVMRLPAGRLVEATLTFLDPGERLVYCTVYCGPGHDGMAGRIVVV
jgi:heme/copper-type cytochrome/quinol oxidase subunit 2